MFDPRPGATKPKAQETKPLKDTPEQNRPRKDKYTNCFEHHHCVCLDRGKTMNICCSFVEQLSNMFLNKFHLHRIFASAAQTKFEQLLNTF